jgi:hypothetical protein
LDADLDYSADCDDTDPSYPFYDFEKEELQKQSQAGTLLRLLDLQGTLPGRSQWI